MICSSRYLCIKNTIAFDRNLGDEIVNREGGNMPAQNWLRELARSEDDRWLGGVCGGLGKHTPLPSWVWRVIFTALFLCVGTGLLLYVLLWIFMPKEH
jgi:phage shock protein C